MSETRTSRRWCVIKFGACLNTRILLIILHMLQTMWSFIPFFNKMMHYSQESMLKHTVMSTSETWKFDGSKIIIVGIYNSCGMIKTEKLEHWEVRRISIKPHLGLQYSNVQHQVALVRRHAKHFGLPYLLNLFTKWQKETRLVRANEFQETMLVIFRTWTKGGGHVPFFSSSSKQFVWLNHTSKTANESISSWY